MNQVDNDQTDDSATIRKLIAAASDVRSHAYAPYSQFQVGAALSTRDGQIFAGCNVENASFGLTLCAERSAASAAIAAGQRDFRTLVLVTRGSVSPCGACRQFLIEFGHDLEVVLVDAEALQITQRVKLAELLPHQFLAFDRG